MKRAMLVTVLATVAVAAGSATAGARAGRIDEAGRLCRMISPDSVRTRTAALTTSYTTDGFEMRRQRGESTCEVTAGQGVCWLRQPGLVHVRTARGNAWFDVPRGFGARIYVRDGRASCRIT